MPQDVVNNSEVSRSVKVGGIIFTEGMGNSTTKERKLTIVSQIEEYMGKFTDPNAIIARETSRLRPLLDAFEKETNVDAHVLTAETVKKSRTVFTSAPLIIEDILQDQQLPRFQNIVRVNLPTSDGGEKEMVFSAVATYSMFGYQNRFGILRSPIKDKDGVEIEHRIPFLMVDDRLIKAMNEKGISKQCLQRYMSVALLSIHDYIHTAIRDLEIPELNKWTNTLRAGKSLAETVEGGPIPNYETMIASLHAIVWKNIYQLKPNAKNNLLNICRRYLTDIEKLDGPDSENMRLHLASMIMRPMMLLMSRQEPGVQEILEKFPEVNKTISYVNGNFMDTIHDAVLLPIGARKLKPTTIARKYAHSMIPVN